MKGEKTEGRKFFEELTYAKTGVDYGKLDLFKLLAQYFAKRTKDNILRLGVKEYGPSRGESVYLLELPDCYIAFVEEGLGTKCLVADAMHQLEPGGRTYYDHIAQCTVAMTVNDMITLGASPLAAAMHLATGGRGEWFDDKQRCQDLVEGFAHACDLAGCVWGPGETPTLKDIIIEGAAVLSCSAVGTIEPKSRLIRGNIRDGDVIVLVLSSGIHANGLTLARQIADRLPDGYLTRLSDGRTYGESLLDPTVIYARLVEKCLDAGIKIHYTVNITGHGWRKLMRLPKEYAYVVERLPPRPAVFDFICENGPVGIEEAYGNLNMGAGFALYVPKGEAKKVMRIAEELGYEALVAGHIAKGARRVEIKPLGIVFPGESLTVR